MAKIELVVSAQNLEEGDRVRVGSFVGYVLEVGLKEIGVFWKKKSVFRVRGRIVFSSEATCDFDYPADLKVRVGRTSKEVSK